ncbi:hypothetical protein REPUB_Repub03eG0133000 [Reevesia pubescens]
MEVGKLFRKPLKLDSNTTLVTGGKFVRICVEVDLRKSLVSKVRLGKHVQKIEYEGLHTVCFSCGIVGHRAENCFSTFKEMNKEVPEKNQLSARLAKNDCARDATITSSNQESSSVGKNLDSFEPWMLVRW